MEDVQWMIIRCYTDAWRAWCIEINNSDTYPKAKQFFLFTLFSRDYWQQHGKGEGKSAKLCVEEEFWRQIRFSIKPTLNGRVYAGEASINFATIVNKQKQMI